MTDVVEKIGVDLSYLNPLSEQQPYILPFADLCC